MIRPPSPFTMLLSRHTRRREFISLLGGAARVAACGARAAGGDAGGWVPRVASLLDDDSSTMAAAFRHGLNEAGYVEGQNVSIEFRWAGVKAIDWRALAAELVRRQVALIATSGTVSSLAAKAATTTIPIVFSTASDPVEVGLVASLNRPGGNATGVANLNVELGPKRLELLHELVPTATILQCS